jgi:hypothetical protein
MRAIGIAGCAALLLCADLDAPAAAQLDAGEFAITWEVKNRFRLFRNEKDFERQVAAYQGSVLAAERRLAEATQGVGWAKDVVDNLCVDVTGKLLETCSRDGERELYLAPRDHRIGAAVTGTVPEGATCAWFFHDGEGSPQQVSRPCNEEVRVRVRYGRPTIVTVDVTSDQIVVQRASTEILVRDLLIAGIGDSFAAGEGNPDRAIKLSDSGFCYRRFGGGEYFRPSREGFRSDRACDATGAEVGSARLDREWAQFGARWMSAYCHRSLYGYQTRAALALAIENPQLAVTYIPLACSGAALSYGVFNTQRVRECPQSASIRCSGTVPSQISQLQEALALARRQRADRQLDLLLLTIGGNDALFSGVVADVITEAATERSLLRRGGLLSTVPEAQRALDTSLPASFDRLRTTLKTFMGDLSRVVYVSYPHPALHSEGKLCPGGRVGFDVHPAFTVSAERLRQASEFVSGAFLPRIKALATCGNGANCRDPANESMTFVDSHQEVFGSRGFCARADSDPVFDRECFSEKGPAFERDLVAAANDPMACPHRASDYRPYSPRARWIRTANDSYFTAMTFPEGLPSVLQPVDIHDAIWAATSAVYGGAVHPTAEGHAAMADAALPAMREILALPEPKRPQPPQ